MGLRRIAVSARAYRAIKATCRPAVSSIRPNAMAVANICFG
jgi:hypothetical protein